MTSKRGPNAERYLQAVRAAIEADLGGPLPAGTSLVPAADRAGSNTATCYPFDGQSVVWCDPNTVEQLTPLVGPAALGAHEFVDVALGLGAEKRGIGINRVLDRPLVDPGVDLGTVAIRPLLRDVADDVALIGALRRAVSDADADEAELDLDDLDPHIVAAIDAAGTADSGRVLALAGARLAESIPFDDIAVITHPDARRRGLGAACVHQLLRSRATSGTPAMYRCEADNTASDRIAQTLGFDLAQVVGSVRFLS